ncbi:MAG: dihydroorotate dehydrogenase electron transfer subunit [Candidatus Thermoplasmatota archaeon]|nr:dihydroorotate dehydrogenase electron transfer subunit [Candidatus Thermoplasmatota archaeon]
MNYPQIVSITKATREAPDIKTFLFSHPGPMDPGQFFMIWIPGIDEIPMSVSYITDNLKGITFRKVGDATAALYALKQGSKIGVRGPYGKGFTLKGKKLLFVGGGTGIAMLVPAIERAQQQNMSTTVILGAKNKQELFFEKRLEDSGSTLYISTDDGSKGYKGYASHLAKEVIAKDSFDSILTCGPEAMMKHLLDSTKKIPFQASIERYMKCGIGLCGQCCVGEGLRVCKEGPVFTRELLDTMSDFGRYSRDAAGRKLSL